MKEQTAQIQVSFKIITNPGKRFDFRGFLQKQRIDFVHYDTSFYIEISLNKNYNKFITSFKNSLQKGQKSI